MKFHKDDLDHIHSGDVFELNEKIIGAIQVYGCEPYYYYRGGIDLSKNKLVQFVKIDEDYAVIIYNGQHYKILKGHLPKVRVEV